jgi:hypothetical protein
MYLGRRLRRCGSRKRLLEHFFPFGLELLKFGVLCHCYDDPCLLDSRYGMSGLQQRRLSSSCRMQLGEEGKRTCGDVWAARKRVKCRA